MVHEVDETLALLNAHLPKDEARRYSAQLALEQVAPYAQYSENGIYIDAIHGVPIGVVFAALLGVGIESAYCTNCKKIVLGKVASV